MVDLLRILNDNGSPKLLVFVFKCKTDPSRHCPHHRPRMKTAEGTKNLQTGIAACNGRFGIDPPSVGSSNSPAYSPAAHRALIALRCAKNCRPFNSVLDEYYQQEVQMLRPGTTIPHAITVSRDICAIYLDMSKHVRAYFKVCFHVLKLTYSDVLCFNSDEITQFTWSLTDGRPH